MLPGVPRPSNARRPGRRHEKKLPVFVDVHPSPRIPAPARSFRATLSSCLPPRHHSQWYVCQSVAIESVDVWAGQPGVVSRTHWRLARHLQYHTHSAATGFFSRFTDHINIRSPLMVFAVADGAAIAFTGLPYLRSSCRGRRLPLSLCAKVRFPRTISSNFFPYATKQGCTCLWIYILKGMMDVSMGQCRRIGSCGTFHLGLFTGFSLDWKDMEQQPFSEIAKAGGDYEDHTIERIERPG